MRYHATHRGGNRRTIVAAFGSAMALVWFGADAVGRRAVGDRDGLVVACDRHVTYRAQHPSACCPPR
jgi:hypothetical protein